MEKDERAMIEAVQNDLADAKKSLRRIEAAARKLGAYYRGRSMTKASNSAMRLEGAAGIALGGMTSAHADASDALVDQWPDDGQIVVLGGGGGR